jgi:LysR family transcriptional regulator, regulator of abg operon
MDMPRRRSAAPQPLPGHSDTPLLDPAGLMLLADIADAGSLSAAARALGATQPALSKQLHRLERALGVPVFERGVRGVRPTEDGAALLPRARAIREQVRQAGEDAAQRRGAREGRLVVALSHFATLVLLPRVIGGFRARWPGLGLQLMPPPFHLDGLREGRPDFAVMSLPARPLGAEIRARALCATRVAVVARPGHPLAGADRLAALAGAAWVLPSPDSSIARGLERACAAAGLEPPHCPVSCETLTGLETLVRHGNLLGVVPEEVHDARAAASGLVRLPLREGIEGPRVALLRWADAPPTPAAADLEAALVEAAHGLARGAVSARLAAA